MVLVRRLMNPIDTGRNLLSQLHLKHDRFNQHLGQLHIQLSDNIFQHGHICGRGHNDHRIDSWVGENRDILV